MSLSNVRDKFVELVGRPDLVLPGAVIGADFYLNEGQKMLDRMLDGGKSGARYFVDVDMGQVLIPLPFCRIVNKVFIADSEDRTELIKIDIHKLMNYFNQPIADMDFDRPAWYSPVWARPFPGSISLTDILNNWLMDTVIDSGHENYNAVLIYPPCESALYSLEVWGKFYSDELINDGDMTWWTEIHPLLLIKAAAMQMEMTYRNTEGVKDWLGSDEMPGTIKGDIKSLNMDIVEEETTEVSRMEG